jgi:hypothetical protein
MSPTSDDDVVKSVTRTGQIIIGALVSGVLVAVVAAVMIDILPKQPAVVPLEAVPGANIFAGWGIGGTVPIITAMVVAVALVELPLAFVIPALVTRRGRQQIAQTASPSPQPGGAVVPPAVPATPSTETGRLAALHLPSLLIGAAMIEGLAFFAAIAYWIERNPIALGLAVVLIALLIARIPSAGRVERWIERQREKLIDERNRA